MKNEIKLTDEEIEKKLKEELEKGYYKEAKKVFNDGAQSYYPNLEESLKEIQEEKQKK